jgi:hypothetical protein
MSQQNKNHTATLRQVEEIIEICIDANMPAALIGVPGIGKSEKIEQLAQKLEIGFQVIDPTHLEALDLTGLPQIQADGKVHYAPPAFLPSEGKGLLVFEEMNRAADPSFQNACLELLTRRQIRDHKLPAGWVPIAVMNPDNGGHLVNALDPAYLDRVLLVETAPSTQEWLNWAKDEKIHQAILEYVELAEPFIAGDTSPRAWANLSKVLFSFEKKGSRQNLLEHLIYGVLQSKKWSAAFTSYYADRKKGLNPEDVLHNYPLQKELFLQWVSGKEMRLDLIQASLHRLSCHLQTGGKIRTPEMDKNLVDFLSDVPSDLLKSRFTFFKSLDIGAVMEQNSLMEASNDG